MDKRLKRKIIFARNHSIHLMMEHVRHHELNAAVQQAEAGRVRKAVQTSAPANDDEPVWSAKTQEIRNRLTGKKTMAKDRWNRFAGTSGGGGKGR